MEMLFFLLRQTFNFAIPLMIVALAGLVSEKGGVVNIGLEGMMVIGAFCSVIFINKTSGILSGQLQLVLAMFIAMAGGMIVSVIHAFASITLRANQIISGIAINTFAPSFAVFVARIILGQSIIPFSNTFLIEQVPVLTDIPVLGDIFFTRFYISTFIGFAIAALVAFTLQKTRFGLRLRACGEHPQAPDSVGINVLQIRYIGVLISGALAGLGGLIYVIPNATGFTCNVYGYGYVALTVLMLGQWNTGKIVVFSFVFGAFSTLAAAYSTIPALSQLGVSTYYFKMIPYVVTLLVFLFSKKGIHGPKAAGQPFEKGMR